MIRRIGQIFLAVLAVLLVGVGVAWAASGTNPIASVFSDDLKVVESDVGFDSFEILEPMTEEALATLPRGAAQAATFHAITKQTMENVFNGLPPFGRDKSKFEPDPVFISAIGRGETNTGNPVTLLVEGGEVCSYAGVNGYGRGNCGDLEAIDKGDVVSWGGENRGRRLDLAGIYNDEVAAIDVLGDGEPPIEIPDNVLELHHLRYQDITLVGLDDEGNELFRDRVPMSMKP
ncbi:MAG: hypothetical protein BGO23_09715 [Solirubrobacterales bacterium 67-14]|nr:MAG: hypothetical protein BGO23_09715 [Solirubrobacterales bacterium 67-14]